VGRRVSDEFSSSARTSGDRGTKDVIVVVLDSGCLCRIREEVRSREIRLREGLITSLRSRDEKLQLKSLLLHGGTAFYHKNSRITKR